MKTPDSPTLSDFLKLGESALTALLGAAHEFQGEMEGKRDVIVRKLDLVTREEFEVAFAMIKKVRVIQESLDKRLKALEKNQSLSTPAPRKRAKQSRAKS